LSVPLEGVVGLLPKDNVQVASLGFRVLVRHPGELERGSVSHSRLNLDINLRRAMARPLAITGLTCLLKALALPSTLPTRPLYVLDEPGPQVLHNRLNAPPLALLTGAHSLGVFGAGSLASGTELLPTDFDGGDVARVEGFKGNGHFQFGVLGPSFLLLPLLLSAKTKEIFKATTTTTTTTPTAKSASEKSKS